MVTGCGLLDVSVLMALFWPPHQHHAAAQSWFKREGHSAWATCALTQLGFVRILSNPAVTGGAVTVEAAVERLAAAMEHAGHRSWPMNLGPAEAIQLSGVKLRGHRQLTDLYLLGLAAKQKGHFVTFDRALAETGPHVRVLR